MEEEPALSQEKAILWLLCQLGLSKTSQHLTFVDISIWFHADADWGVNAV